MNKAEFITALADRTSITKRDTEKVFDAFQDILTETLVHGEDVKFSGLGTFAVVERAARQGRNPKTGQPVQIEASKTTKFKLAPSFKKALNGDGE